MGFFTDTQRALDKRLNALGLSETVVFENVTHTPATGTSYVRTNLLTGPSAVAAISGEQENPGIYVIDIFVELEKGPGAYNTVVDSIYDHFKAQDVLIEGTTEVWIQEVSRTLPVRDEQLFHGSVDISFSVFTL